MVLSSVSSEQAFSQGGITFSKRWNRLKGNLVEALQCLKCSLRHDFLFHDPGPSSIVESQEFGLGDSEDGSGEELGVADDDDGNDSDIGRGSSSEMDS